MQKLHPNQEKLLHLLEKNIDEPLTVRELKDELKLSSTSVVQHHINKLIEKGYLKRNPTNPYDYHIIGSDPEKQTTIINVYGMAQCGPHGSILDGNPVDKIKISSKLLGFPAELAFIVKARGDSMTPRINPGDLVIAKKSETAQNGDVVVCVNNEEVLIKKLQIINNAKESKFNLISLNEKYLPFLANESFKIEGIVKGVLNYSL